MEYSFLLASSYRFECILLRLMCPRWQSRDLTRSEWTKCRLRLAVFELDTIVGRMLANNALSEVPLSFTTCIPILLALHIETALDTAELDVTRSMSRISISQAMLVLKHMAEIPPIQQILPIFERVLARHNLTPCTTDALNSNALQRNPEPTTNKEVHDAPWYAGFFATGWQDLPDFDDFSFDDFTGFEFVDN
ncbi:hypothetical protein EDB81DRAFT_375234 [Dactylonectria macrodidyma]|uniref:Uncharacterized protein n=1 Tax=Dactylonectria macrodidyma TaxID=307937 RepID=A0A9P9I6M5_9HYPO|nr:hypothetical protein EDB81DRAFT_375234 [Dactylonectria macrodidyma]